MRTTDKQLRTPEVRPASASDLRPRHQLRTNEIQPIAAWALPMGLAIWLIELLGHNFGTVFTALLGVVALTLCCLGLNRLWLTVIVLILVMLPLTQLSLPLDPRFAALIPLAVLASHQNVKPDGEHRLLIPVYLAGVTLVSAASTVVTGRITDLLIAPAALALLTLGALVVAMKVPKRDFVLAGLLVTSSILILSLLALTLGLTLAQRADRLQGFVANPNGLGTVAVFAMAFALLRSNRAFALTTPFAFVLIYLSESRASGAAALLLLLTACIMLLRSRWKTFPALISTVLVAGLSYLFWLSLAIKVSGGIFRTNNSREATWEVLVDDFHSSPVFGVGWEQASAGSQGFFHLMAAQAGLIGLTLAFAATAIVAHSLSSLGWRGIVIACAIAILVLFEGWLFVGGSGYAWLVWLLGASRPTTATGQDERRDCAADGHSRCTIVTPTSKLGPLTKLVAVSGSYAK